MSALIAQIAQQRLSSKHKRLIVQSRFKHFRMSEIHSNSKTDKNLVIPLRDDLRNEPVEDDEEQDEQQTKGFFKKCLHRIAECIEIHVEVKLSPRLHISYVTYDNFLDDIFWERPSATGL